MTAQIGDESCTDLSSFCSPTLCGEWSRAMEDCRKTCHPACRYQIQDGFQPSADEETTEWYTTTATTTTTTSTTTTQQVLEDSGKCKCLDPDTGRSFEEMSILKVDTSPGCSIRLICGQGCAKLYKLPEHCVSVTSTTTSSTTTTKTTTTTSTTTKLTTQKTTQSTSTTTQLPTIPSVNRQPVHPVRPTNECYFGDTRLALNHYHFVDNCQYIQCVYDAQLRKPFIYLRNGCYAPTRLTILSCFYNGAKLTVGEVISAECGVACTYQSGAEQATLNRLSCQQHTNHYYPVSAGTTKPLTTVKPRTTAKRTTPRRTTRRTTTRKVRTTKAPRTKKPKRIPGKWKRMCQV